MLPLSTLPANPPVPAGVALLGGPAPDSAAAADFLAILTAQSAGAPAAGTSAGAATPTPPADTATLPLAAALPATGKSLPGVLPLTRQVAAPSEATPLLDTAAETDAQPLHAPILPTALKVNGLAHPAAKPGRPSPAVERDEQESKAAERQPPATQMPTTDPVQASPDVMLIAIPTAAPLAHGAANLRHDPQPDVADTRRGASETPVMAAVPPSGAPPHAASEGDKPTAGPPTGDGFSPNRGHFAPAAAPLVQAPLPDPRGQMMGEASPVPRALAALPPAEPRLPPQAAPGLVPVTADVAPRLVTELKLTGGSPRTEPTVATTPDDGLIAGEAAYLPAMPPATGATPMAHQATPAAAAGPATASYDFAQLVDRLVAARDASQPQAVSIALRHADFGPIQVHFRQDDGALSVQLASPDPDFARAVTLATAPVQPAAANPAMGDNPSSQHPSARSDPGMTSSADAQAQQRGHGQRDDRHPRPGPARHPAADQPAGQSAQSGIFA